MPSRHPHIVNVRHFVVTQDDADVIGHVSIYTRSDGFRYVGEAAIRTSPRLEDLLASWVLWVTERPELSDLWLEGHTYTLRSDGNRPLDEIRRYLHATRVRVERDEIDHPTYTEMMGEIERIMQG